MPETIEIHTEHFVSYLREIGYLESCICTYERQRLSGDWDQYYEISDPYSGQLLVVVGQSGAAASIESYAANLGYRKYDEAVLLSRTEDAGIQGFLVEPGRDMGLRFFRVSFSGGKADSADIEPVSEFPSLARLKNRYRLRILSQKVMSATEIVRPRNRANENSYQRFNNNGAR